MQQRLTRTAAAVIAVAAVVSSAFGAEIHKRTRFMMDTYVTIQAVGPKKATLKAVDAAMDRMEVVDEKYNSIGTGSPIYKFNKEGEPITDPEIIALIKAAQAISRKSDGAFDITIFPLIQLWGFYSDDPQVPTKEAIEKHLDHVGYEYLKVERDKVSPLKEGVQIELGGIAKGLAIHVAVKELKENGVESAMVDAGGDIFAYGTIDGGPWKVGIRNPRGDGIIAAVSANDLAVVTSGDYERYFEKDGVRYHHLISPETGYPVKGLTSVTVFSRSPILADAWSTALFVLGPDRALKTAEEVPQIEAVLVHSDGRVEVTKALGEGIEIIQRDSE